MFDFPREVWIRKCISCKPITIIITERGGVCCSRNPNNLTACLRIYSSYNLSSSDFETLFVFSVASSWDFNFLFFWSDSKIISVLYSAILELSFENESQCVWFKDFFSNKRNIKMPKSQYIFSWKIGRKNSYQITLLTKTNNKTKQFNSRSNK